MPKEDLFRTISSAECDSETSLLPRFACVREALALAIGNKLPGFEVMQTTGSDQGIQDHKIFIRGRTNGIDLIATIKGTIVDRQPFIVKSKNGRFITLPKKIEYWEINGRFILPDRMNGVVRVFAGDVDHPSEAYWQQDIGGGFRLGQIVVDGRVYDADKLSRDNMGNVIVPEKDERFPYFIY